MKDIGVEKPKGTRKMILRYNAKSHVQRQKNGDAVSLQSIPKVDWCL